MASLKQRLFAQLHARFARDVLYLAHRQAKGDYDLRDDLAQEGLIVLWRLAVRRSQPVVRTWVRRRIWYRMRHYLRGQCPSGLHGRRSTMTEAWATHG